MKHLFDVNPAKDNKKFDSFLLKTKKELSEFFGIQIEDPNIFFLHSRKDVDSAFGRKTESWLCAWAKSGNIYILHPEVYETESDHKIDHFWKTIKHEYTHLYFKQLTGIGYPKWLNEGLACYLAGQEKKVPTCEEAIKIFNYFEKGDSMVYGVGYFWVKLLIEKFGKKKFLVFLKQLEPNMSERKFAYVFYATYKIHFNKKELEVLFSKSIG